VEQALGQHGGAIQYSTIQYNTVPAWCMVHGGAAHKRSGCQMSECFNARRMLQCHRNASMPEECFNATRMLQCHLNASMLKVSSEAFPLPQLKPSSWHHSLELHERQQELSGVKHRKEDTHRPGDRHGAAVWCLLSCPALCLGRLATLWRTKQSVLLAQESHVQNSTCLCTDPSSTQFLDPPTPFGLCKTLSNLAGVCRSL
jgi:hypothetical protein